MDQSSQMDNTMSEHVDVAALEDLTEGDTKLDINIHPSLNGPSGPSLSSLTFENHPYTGRLYDVQAIYALKNNVPADTLKFLFNGIDVEGHESARQLNMKHGQGLVVEHRFDTGQNRTMGTEIDAAKVAALEDEVSKDWELSLRHPSEHEQTVPIHIHMPKHSRFLEAMSMYREQFGFEENDLRFYANGSRLVPDDNPYVAGMRDGDVIQAAYVGGLDDFESM